MNWFKFRSSKVFVVVEGSQELYEAEVETTEVGDKIAYPYSSSRSHPCLLVKDGTVKHGTYFIKWMPITQDMKDWMTS